MRNALRLVCVVAMLVVVAFPLSAAGRAGRQGTKATARLTHGRNMKDVLCLIDCGDGRRTWDVTPTRGGCLDACEEFCGTTCTISA